MTCEQLSFAPPAHPKPRIPYGGRAPHTRGSDTSREAAESIEVHKGTLQWRMLQYYRACGLRGSTDQEGQRALDIAGNTWRPRRNELAAMGFVKETTETRKTESGRGATVWRAT